MADDSPMRVQYRSLKKDHPNDILFFRLGDFYEMFDEDAVEVSGLLNLTLTSRNGQPMCGVPYHAARSYIARLLKAGKKIAVCEQLSVPGPGKGLAERRVVEVITPGTTVEEDYLDKGSSNYLAAVARRKDALSFAYVEVSTGEFYASSFPVSEAEDRLRKELERTHPKELIVQESFLEDHAGAARIIGERSDLVVDRWPDWLFDPDRALKRLLAQFSTSSLRGFGLDDGAAETLSAGALLFYLDDTAKSLLPHIRSLKVYTEADFLILDESTQRNLELVRNLRDGDERFSLLESLDETKTAMGARLLKNRLLRPLVDPRVIGERLDAVEALYRAQGKLAAVRDALSKSLDLERLCSRVAMDRAHGKDLVAIGDSLDAYERVETIAEGLLPELSDEDTGRLDAAARSRLGTLRATIAAAMAEDPSILLTEGNLIRDGYDAELDRLKALKEGGREALEAYLQEEREATGLSALRIKYNRLIGYFFELSKNHAAAVPDRFIRRQSMADAERFTTDKLAALESELNGAAEKVVELEKRLFLELRETVKAAVPDLVSAARRIAVLDVTQSLARAATVRAWNRPVVDSSKSIRIVEGRHPVVESNLPRGEFVPNDLFLDADGADSVSFALVTGPNMAGKSTYLRQSALIVLLAQIGSFVPAREAEIGVVDKVFCRVGASDNLARGESTFLVEMNETANILRNATERSLVVMDEVGRGTGTNDGLAIARAVCEELLDSIGCRTLFATHYHELSRIAHPRLANRSMEVAERDGGIVFLRRLREGATTESYGIHVAGLAGLPERVLSRAAAILERLKANEIVLSSALDAKTPEDVGSSPHTIAVPGASPDSEADSIGKALMSIDLDRTTPLEALELLYRLKSGIPPIPAGQRHRKASSRTDSGPELF